MDDRVRKLARIMIGYSIKVKKGDVVSIACGIAGRDLVAALYEELLMKGAFPVVQMVPHELAEIFYRKGKRQHFETITPYQKAVAKTVDSSIHIYAEDNTRLLSAVDPKKQSAYATATRPLVEMRRHKPWLISLFPTQAYAQDAEMSLSDFEDFVYSAVFADKADPIAEWKKQSKFQAKMISRLRNADKVRIVGEGTDISFSVKGRTFMNSDGSEHNMPSGEIYTAPIETTAEGCIEYDFPVCQSGREISGIRLVFKKGVVVEATAEKNEKYLLAMLDSDKGARRIGELGIGMNMRIQQFVRRILFDEKIGGTIHLALGNSILGTGGKNKSAIHWDMIKDLRKGGALYIDGKVIQKNGKFV